MAELNSFQWVELAVLAPGQSHYWFFDQARDLHGWVFQATAYPEPAQAHEENALAARRIEVTELFILRTDGENQGTARSIQINITVTNCGDRWTPYSLWVVSIPPQALSAERAVVHTNHPRGASDQAGDAIAARTMKILLVHDEYGNVRSAAITATEPNLRARLRVERGEFVTEIEEPVIAPEELRSRPREFCEGFRVDRAGGRLLAKNS